MFLKPKHFIFKCRPNFGSFCPLPGLLRAITFSTPKPPPLQISAYATAPIYLHLKLTNSRAALCEDFTMLAIAQNWGQRCLAQTAIVTYKQTLAAPAFFGLSVINCTV